MKRLNVFPTPSGNNEKGFTLIEALIGLLVFTIGILATVSMQVSALQGNSIARNNTDAAAIAASVVEELKGLPYDHPDLAAGDHALDNVGHHTVAYTVQDDSIIANTKSVRVSVGWNDGATARAVNLDYLLPDII